MPKATARPMERNLTAANHVAAAAIDKVLVPELWLSQQQTAVSYCREHFEKQWRQLVAFLTAKTATRAIGEVKTGRGSIAKDTMSSNVQARSTAEETTFTSGTGSSPSEASNAYRRGLCSNTKVGRADEAFRFATRTYLDEEACHLTLGSFACWARSHFHTSLEKVTKNDFCARCQVLQRSAVRASVFKYRLRIKHSIVDKIDRKRWGRVIEWLSQGRIN